MPDLLHKPAVAVWIVEGEERGVVAALRVSPGCLAARPEVEELTGVHPTFDKFGARNVDVRDDQVGTSSA